MRYLQLGIKFFQSFCPKNKVQLLLAFTSIVHGQANLAIADPGKKYALVLAVSKYSQEYEEKWPDLHCQNDAIIVTKMLTKKGFHGEDITNLKDNAVTTKNVNNAFNEIIQKLKTGDIFYFHYSGHGQQILDLSGDEDDGLDEALAFYDAPAVCSIGYKFQNHFSDDSMRSKIERIRAKVGPKGQVVVVIDACHAGTMSRSGEANLIKLCHRGHDKVGPCLSGKTKSSNTSISPNYNFDFDTSKSNLADVFSLFACSPYQLCLEYKLETDQYYGSLSYFWVNALSTIPECSFEKAIAHIKKNIHLHVNASQDPTLEGKNIDKIVFTNKTAERLKLKHYFTISNKIEGDKRNQQIVVGGGAINGLFAGDSLDIYRVERGDTSKFTSAVISEITSAIECKALCKLNGPILAFRDNNNVIKYYAEKTGSAKKFEKINLKISIENPKIRKRVASALGKYENINLVKSDCDYQLKDDSTGRVGIYINDCGLTLFRSQKPVNITFQDSLDFLLWQLSVASKIKAVRNLAFSDAEVDFLIQYRKCDSMGKIVDTSVISKNEWTCDKSNYLISIHNRTKDYIYLSAFEINSNNELVPLKTISGKNAEQIIMEEDQVLNKENQILVRCSEAGTSQIILIASKEAGNFTPLKSLIKPKVALRSANSKSTAFVQFLEDDEFMSVPESKKTHFGVTTKSLWFFVEP